MNEGALTGPFLFINKKRALSLPVKPLAFSAKKSKDIKELYFLIIESTSVIQNLIKIP